MLDYVDSMIIECELYRIGGRCTGKATARDGGRARKQLPPKVTLENVDRNYDDPGVS
jgi:hypothetical protein